MHMSSSRMFPVHTVDQLWNESLCLLVGEVRSHVRRIRAAGERGGASFTQADLCRDFVAVTGQLGFFPDDPTGLLGGIVARRRSEAQDAVVSDYFAGVSGPQQADGGGEAQEDPETLSAELVGRQDGPIEDVLSVPEDHPRGALAASS